MAATDGWEVVVTGGTRALVAAAVAAVAAVAGVVLAGCGGGAGEAVAQAADAAPATSAALTTTTTAVAGAADGARAAGVAPGAEPAPGTTLAVPPVAAGGPEIVNLLVVAPEGPRDGYDRSLFEHWVDADGDGCDTRCEVLAAERRADLAGLPAGGWLSIYDGYWTDDPSELDVDHVVALAEAWESGASGWDAATRRAFANDLDHPGALVAVTAATNRSKSDRDPASWQPPNRDAWCEFAASWVWTKVRWRLTADLAEVQALRNMLAGCG